MRASKRPGKTVVTVVAKELRPAAEAVAAKDPGTPKTESMVKMLIPW